MDFVTPAGSSLSPSLRVHGKIQDFGSFSLGDKLMFCLGVYIERIET